MSNTYLLGSKHIGKPGPQGTKGDNVVNKAPGLQGKQGTPGLQGKQNLSQLMLNGNIASTDLDMAGYRISNVIDIYGDKINDSKYDQVNFYDGINLNKSDGTTSKLTLRPNKVWVELDNVPQTIIGLDSIVLSNTNKNDVLNLSSTALQFSQAGVISAGDVLTISSSILTISSDIDLQGKNLSNVNEINEVAYKPYILPRAVDAGKGIGIMFFDVTNNDVCYSTT